MASIPDYADLSTPFVYRVELKAQPVGGKVTYTTTCHVKKGISISETLQVALPVVISSLKLENGVREMYESTIASFPSQKVTPERWDVFVSITDGNIVTQASGEVTVGR